MSTHQQLLYHIAHHLIQRFEDEYVNLLRRHEVEFYLQRVWD
ncbi:MAG: hypothetical protein O2856_12895 [Planctomycetota bacterium]|nr:hypothetical protein [Planctomycetota bacterium]